MRRIARWDERWEWRWEAADVEADPRQVVGRSGVRGDARGHDGPGDGWREVVRGRPGAHDRRPDGRLHRVVPIVIPRWHDGELDVPHPVERPARGGDHAAGARLAGDPVDGADRP